LFLTNGRRAGANVLSELFDTAFAALLSGVIGLTKECSRNPIVGMFPWSAAISREKTSVDRSGGLWENA